VSARLPHTSWSGFVMATGVRQKGGIRGDQVSRCCDGV
jgi:hypothetical protein